MENHPPGTEPSGVPTPWPSDPVTALTTSAPRSAAAPIVSRSPARLRGVRGLVDSALDRLDALADRIADAAGIR